MLVIMLWNIILYLNFAEMFHFFVYCRLLHCQQSSSNGYQSCFAFVRSVVEFPRSVLIDILWCSSTPILYGNIAYSLPCTVAAVTFWIAQFQIN